MTNTIKLTPDGRVLVGGELFARFALGPAEPARDYGASHVLRIWPVLDRQDEPGWSERFRLVCEMIHAHVLSQN